MTQTGHLADVFINRTYKDRLFKMIFHDKKELLELYNAEGILEEFLSRNRAEAKKVSIYEYNEEKVLRDLMNDGIEQGLEQGMAQGESAFASLAQKLLLESKTEELLKATQDKAFRDSLYKEYGISLTGESDT